MIFAADKPAGATSVFLFLRVVYRNRIAGRVACGGKSYDAWLPVQSASVGQRCVLTREFVSTGKVAEVPSFRRASLLCDREGNGGMGGGRFFLRILMRVRLVDLFLQLTRNHTHGAALVEGSESPPFAPTHEKIAQLFTNRGLFRGAVVGAAIGGSLAEEAEYPAHSCG